MAPPFFVSDDDVLAPAALSTLRAAIAGSKLIGESQLVGAFEATRGFGVACHTSAVDEAVARVPWLAPFVALALDDERRARLFSPSFVEQLGAAVFADVNALYVNVLVVPSGGAVATHVDSTLGVVDDEDAVVTARAVAVLYVDVPDDLDGGDLVLRDSGVEVGRVRPQNNRFVLFRGSLHHEVTATTSSRPRVSCVCELYALPRARLARLPRVRVQSRGFADVLARLRS